MEFRDILLFVIIIFGVWNVILIQVGRVYGGIESAFALVCVIVIIFGGTITQIIVVMGINEITTKASQCLI